MPDDGPFVAPFPHMRHAKRHASHPGARHLGLSGIHTPPAALLQELGVEPLDDAARGADLWREAVARREGVPVASVLPALGTSGANFLVALTLARGGRIAGEEPGYQAFRAIAEQCGASWHPLALDFGGPRRIDPSSLERLASDGVDLVFVSDLHNPTGTRLSEEDYDALGRFAETTRAWIVVDEVYRDFDSSRRPSAVHRGPRFLVTSSLTKFHGLSGLRAGFILGPSDVIERLDAVGDVVSPALPPTLLTQAAAYLEHADDRAAVVRDRAAYRRERMQRWIDATPHVSWIRPDGGISAFVRIGDGPETDQGDRLAAALASRHDIQVMPGSFFQRPAWVRISFDLDDDVLGVALDRVALVAREITSRPEA